MNFRIDIDDTITRCPAFFAFTSKALRSAGHKVYILSYREDRGFAEEDLAEYGIEYDELVLPADEDIRGVPWQEWKGAAARWKAETCRQHGIDIFFEDMPEVVNALDSTVTVFMPVDPALGSVCYEVERGS